MKITENKIRRMIKEELSKVFENEDVFLKDLEGNIRMHADGDGIPGDMYQVTTGTNPDYISIDFPDTDLVENGVPKIMKNLIARKFGLKGMMVQLQRKGAGSAILVYIKDLKDKYLSGEVLPSMNYNSTNNEIKQENKTMTKKHSSDDKLQKLFEGFRSFINENEETDPRFTEDPSVMLDADIDQKIEAALTNMTPSDGVVEGERINGYMPRGAITDEEIAKWNAQGRAERLIVAPQDEEIILVIVN